MKIYQFFIFLLLVSTFQFVQAIPVTYKFTSAPIDDFTNEIIGPLQGSIVSGTFDYDNAVPLTANNIIFPGDALYLGAMSNLSGGIAGFGFSSLSQHRRSL